MFFKSLLYVFSLMCGLNPVALSGQRPDRERLEYRAAFDLGSGKLKMQSAWVDPRRGKIVEMAESSELVIPLREAIDGDPNGKIPEEVAAQLQDALAKMQAQAESHGAIPKYVGGATASFRAATNGEEIIDWLGREQGISIYLLSSEEEASLGRESLLAEGLLPKEDALIWENGGGSTQISRKTAEGLKFFNLSVGKVAMKAFLIEEVQGRKGQASPNPISREEADRAIAWSSSKFQGAPEWAVGADALGIGAMFPNVMRGLGKSTFSKGDLKQLIEERLGKTDEELGGDAYIVSDLLFLYGAMDALGIEQVVCPKMRGPGSTSGLLIDAQKWESTSP